MGWRVTERAVYLTNSLVNEGKHVTLAAANIYTATTCLTTHDHLTTHLIEPIHVINIGFSIS